LEFEESNLDALRAHAYQWQVARYDAQDRPGHARPAADLAENEGRDLTGRRRPI
jgi:hypothetical protein